MWRRAMVGVLSVCACLFLGLPRDARAQQLAGPGPEVRLFDTGAALPDQLDPRAFARMDGWTAVAEGATAHRFAGDAVVLNNRIAVVLRTGTRGPEVYSSGGLRAVLAPGTASRLAGLAAVKTTAVSPAAVSLEASYRCEDGTEAALSLELKMGEAQVKTTPVRGVEALRVEAPCRFAVLPDFFADDIVIDAAQIPVEEADLPAENMLLHMLPDRNAIVMAVWETSDRDVRMSLSGTGDDRRISGAHVYYGESRAVWVAVLEAPAVWHVRDVAAGDAGKTLRLDWQQPWPAHWRVDWTRHDGLVDSWEMLAQNSDGTYLKPNWTGWRDVIRADRQRWTTVLGSFTYPCWSDRDGQVYLEPLTQPGEWNTRQVVRFEGPALIYPMNRIQDTPLDTLTVLDVVRNSLGVGPCQYILDVEAGQSVNRGIATCAARDTLNPIYEAGTQKQQKAKIEKTLIDVVTFIRFIRSRIDTYVEFGHGVLAYLEQQKEAHPELAAEISELEGLARTIDVRVAERQDAIKTPEYAALLAEEFRRTVLDKDDPDALARCRRITAEWVEIGGNQDHLAGECRWAAKFLRQRAGLMMAQDPRLAEICREIRSRAEAAMARPAGHEAIHH